MIVIHIISNLNRGGAELMLLRIIKKMKQNYPEIENIVISLSKNGELERDFKSSGVTVYSYSLNRFKLFPAVFKIHNQLRKIKPDIIQTWMVHADVLGGIIGRFAGIKRVIWGVRTTDYSVESKKTQNIRKLASKLSHFIPSKIVCAAQASLENSITAGYRADIMTVIPNGFYVSDHDYIDRFKDYDGINQFEFELAEPLIGTLGRDNEAKDHKNFLLAAKKVLKEHKNAKFIITGKGVSLSSSIPFQIIEKLGIQGSVVLRDETLDVLTYLSGLDIFVLSSKTEGFPNALGEAMSVCTPCITTDVGDAAFLLNEDEWTVPPTDSDALAEAILRMLELSDSDRNEIGSRGSFRIKQFFSMDAVCKNLCDVYNENGA